MSGLPFSFVALSMMFFNRSNNRLRGQQEISSRAPRTDSAVKVFPKIVGLHVNFVHAPVVADWVLAFTGYFLNERQNVNLLSIDWRIVN
ncbi:hypothetical protein IFT68_23115 [Oxalobacteraceae sp. CFBP 13730]|nr:hypothetical protein [Oxalobacteraceae sp. CFBP 13730]